MAEAQPGTGTHALGTIRFVDLQKLHGAMEATLEEAFRGVLADASFTLGEKVEAFEDAFASYVGVRVAVGVGSGTDALFLALKACGAGPGGEVITAVNTFAATAEAIAMTGARPVFVDVRDDTLLMDLQAVESAITENTQAIVPVHLYGQPVDMPPLMELARARGLRVIEDACQSHGARCGVDRTGGIGDAGCFSFYPGKNLGALGDGGIVTTNDEAIAERIRLLRNHGEDGSRLHVEQGYCTRLHALQAAFLSAKLPHLDEWNALRMGTAALYDDLLSSADVVLPQVGPDVTHVYHLYVVRVRDRDRVRLELGERGVQTGIHYALPLHLERAFASLGYSAGDFPVAEEAAASIVSLPMHPYMEHEEVARVSQGVAEAAGRV